VSCWGRGLEVEFTDGWAASTLTRSTHPHQSNRRDCLPPLPLSMACPCSCLCHVHVNAACPCSCPCPPQRLRPRPSWTVSTASSRSQTTHTGEAAQTIHNNNTVWRNLLWNVGVALASERHRSYPLHIALPHRFRRTIENTPRQVLYPMTPGLGTLARSYNG